MPEITLAAEARTDAGSSSSRRLRREGRIPAVVYGHGTSRTAVSVVARELRQALNTEAGVNALIALKVGTQKYVALAREIQRHPVRNTVHHVDFYVVNQDEAVTADVPINFIGEAEAVRRAGGIVEHVLNAITISSVPSKIPAHIDVDLTNLEPGGSIRVGDLVLPAGVVVETPAEEPVAVAAAVSEEVAPEAEAAEPVDSVAATPEE